MERFAGVYTGQAETARFHRRSNAPIAAVLIFRPTTAESPALVRLTGQKCLRTPVNVRVLFLQMLRRSVFGR